MRPPRPAVLVAALVTALGLVRARVAAQPPVGGALDALTLPRGARIAHYSSTDTTGGNDDARPIAPGATLTLVDHHGAGIVRRWWITIAPRDDVAIQRQLVVRCWWDDEPTPSVEVPVSDFFGVGFGEWRQFTSAVTNMTSGGYDTYWPMPFRRHARITVENRSSVPVGAFYYNVDIETHDPGSSPGQAALPDSTLYFHAQFRRVTTTRGTPVTLLEAEGRGQYVGTVLSMQPRRGRALWFLEGDERVFVDGETRPSIVGTGTEDYFSSGWYFDTGPYSSLYHGLTIKDSLTGRISAYRWHILDPIPFTRSLRFTIEHGGTNDAPATDYSSVAFWYQTHPHRPFPPLPDTLLPYAAVPPARIPGATEGESLVAAAHATAGRVLAQDMGAWDGDSAGWSGGAQLWWVEAHPGARLTLPLRVRTAGVYELVARFTRAPDYGDVRLSLDGHALAPVVHGYAPAVAPTGPISFGRATLRAGDHALVLEIVGKDPRAHGYSDGFLVGLDAIELRRAR